MLKYKRKVPDMKRKVLHLFRKNYECFLDVEKLNVGNFRENIAFEMEKCRIFLLILSRNALNRCANQEDNVRQEIEAAMERGLEIIPVTDEDFVWPETMPEGLERIKDLNAIPYVQVYSDQFFERLYSFIDNIWAEDRAKEAAVRGERRAAKAAGICGRPRALFSATRCRRSAAGPTFRRSWPEGSGGISRRQTLFIPDSASGSKRRREKTVHPESSGHTASSRCARASRI